MSLRTLHRIVRLVILALLVSFFTAMVVFAAGVARTRSQLNHLWKVEPAAIAIPSDPASIVEGRRLYLARGCAECHGQDAGGKAVLNDRALGTFQASNLTRGAGGIAAVYRDVDWVRSIREGIKPDGHAIMMMPSQELHWMSDGEVGAIAGYLRNTLPVDHVLPPSHIGPTMYLAFGLARSVPLLAAETIDHKASRPAAVTPAASVAFGEYLARVQCAGCHGQTFSGGPIPGEPDSVPTPRNLTADASSGLGIWTEPQFRTAMRTGRRPDGSNIDPFMPWPAYSQLTDDELGALWMYLRQVPTKPFGQR